MRLECIARGGSSKKWTSVYEDAPLHHASASHVALKKYALGQGTERYAFQLYEVGVDRSILGDPMIAKLNLSTEESTDQNKFMRTYMFAQKITRKLAGEFNSKLDRQRTVSKETPRISVLDCSIYHLGPTSVLVEPRLDHTRWEKWNSNNGVSSRAALSVLPADSVSIPLFRAI